MLEHALAIRTAHQRGIAERVETRFALALACTLWSAPASEGRNRSRARPLAGQAHDDYAALGNA